VRSLLTIAVLFLLAPWFRVLVTGELLLTDSWPDGTPRTVQAYRLDLSGQKVFHGHHAMFSESGALLVQGEFRRGQRHGLWTWRHDNGDKQAECQYDNDEGEFRSWHPNGQRFLAGRYHGLVRIGMWREFYPSGRKRLQGEYRDDKQHGTWLAWTDEDQPQEIRSVWRDGERIE